MKRVAYSLILCLALALCGCNDDSKPQNHFPGGSVKREEQPASAQAAPVENSTPGKLPGGSVKRN